MPRILRQMLTPLWVLLTLVMVLGVVVCFLLARWQWQMFQQEGSGQNFAYTIQWPAFAVFGVYMWWRMLRDTARERAGQESATAVPGEPAPDGGRPGDDEPGPVISEGGVPQGAPQGDAEAAEDGAERLIARLGRGGSAASTRVPTARTSGEPAEDTRLAAYNDYLGSLAGGGRGDPPKERA